MALFKKVYGQMDIQMAIKYSLTKALGQCNKSMLIGTNAELRQFMKQDLNSESMYFGADKFLSHLRAWTMEEMRWDRKDVLYIRFQSIIHSGIFSFLKKKANKVKLGWSIRSSAST